ncbi:CAAX prenyl protease 2-like [Amphiura filiformis]|uniref:CAAX prenyl protease 2-like n=1 Tax=Amphiura filiformis TaxID=82378 RepID=UPI003B215A02
MASDTEVTLFECSSYFRSIFSCFLLSVAYVGSLYVWGKHLARDHPTTIKKRCASVMLVSLLSPILLYALSTNADTSQSTSHSLWSYLGVRSEGILAAVFIPLLLTMVLFLGPLSMLKYEDLVDALPILGEKSIWKDEVIQTFWLRNYVVGPLTEEVVFRACMLPLLVPCMSYTKAIFICPLFFGVAHIHHVIERLRQGNHKPVHIWFSAIFQFSYTSVFGAYSAFIFLRTGHIIGPIICHTFCNFMGFPEFGTVLRYPPLRRLVVSILYIIGLIGFIYLLFPLTEPSWYSNNVYPW